MPRLQLLLGGMPGQSTALRLKLGEDAGVPAYKEAERMKRPGAHTRPQTPDTAGWGEGAGLGYRRMGARGGGQFPVPVHKVVSLASV